MSNLDSPRDVTRRMRLSGSALIAAAALGPLLLGSSLYVHLMVRALSDDVLRGEAAGWGRTLGSRVRDLPPSAAVLGAMLDESRAEGLRYVAYIGAGGRVEAGESAGRVDQASLQIDTMARVGNGNIVRFAVRPPRPFGPRGAPPMSKGPRPDGPFGHHHPDDHGPFPGGGPGPFPGGPGPPHDDERGRPPMPPPGPILVVEFEPRAWNDLVRVSNRSLTIGSVTAVAVVLLSLWVWRSMRRQQAAVRQAERARHLADLGEMSAVLAHEIRNPLASLKGHAQLLVEGLGAAGLDRPRAKAERVVNEAVRLEGITTDLLDFVRQSDLERTPTELTALVRQAVEEIVPPERLRLHLPAEPLWLAVDASKLRQVIDNVVRNAVQAPSDDAGPIEITLEDGGYAVTLSVRDHGPGIAEGQEERIFEPFVTTRVRGTGLGLAISRRLVNRHGGTLTASNHALGGAVFRLTLAKD